LASGVLLGRALLRRFVFSIAILLVLEAEAAGDPTSLTGSYSDYEKTAIRDAETKLGAHIDPSPEGKTIERIDFVRLPPIDPNDPLPPAINAAHVTSKEFVLRRALFVREGDPYRAVLVDESARSLRRLRQLSTVVCVAMNGSAADRVRLVVITKDVWSLYVDFDLALTSGGLESLTLEPKETNIAGMHHVANGRFILEPKTITTGAAYEIPRLDGRWLSLAVDANAMVNRDSGTLEGGYGVTKVQRPLFSSRTEWAWSVSSAIANRVRRRYVNAEVATFTDEATGTAVPWSWRERSIKQEASITRSFGWETKNDFTLGASFAHARYDAEIENGAFRRAAIPVGEDRVGPYLQWRTYRSDFLRTYDLAGLALQEDHRLGHEIQVRGYPVLRALGSTRDVFGLAAGASYTAALGDGIARAAVEVAVESDTARIADGSVKGSLGIATPRFGPSFLKGRLVFGASAQNRFENYMNAQSFLGGESLLRGYPSRYLAGKDLVNANLEYRTRAIDLVVAQVGAALFYDAGDAFNGFDRLDPKQSVGGGLRIVFPQIDRAVLRVDVGVPVGHPPADVPPVSLFVAFHQALALPILGQ
jgi:hypothetical protein